MKIYFATQPRSLKEQHKTLNKLGIRHRLYSFYYIQKSETGKERFKAMMKEGCLEKEER